MKPPIIEVRKDNVFVLMRFDGALTSNSIRTRHNLLGNHVLHVVDSAGALWDLTFERTDHRGVRKAISTALWNISSDYYTYVSCSSITVEAFKRIIGPHLNSANPDIRELAASLLEPLAQCPASDALSKYIPLLNL